MTSISIPNSVTVLGTYAFSDADKLEKVTLGTGITSIQESAFAHCDSLTDIMIPYRVTSIGKNAFANCVLLTEINIPRVTSSIDSTAFSYPLKMTIYGIAGTYAETFANNQGISFVNNEVAATSAVLNKSNLTMNVNETEKLNLSILPLDFTDEVSWKSSDTNVATISSDGTVTAKSGGTATIKITVGNISTSCKVVVLQQVTSISLNSSSISLNAQDTYKLNANVYPSNATNKDIKWESSDSNIATVDDNGLVTAISKGSAVITVTALDGKGAKKTCTVTVNNNMYTIEDHNDIEDLESPHNYENNCSDYWVYKDETAETLSITFDERTSVEDGFDYIYIYNADSEQVGKYTGSQLAGKTLSITGNTIKIKLVSDSSGSEWGFKVTDIGSDVCLHDDLSKQKIENRQEATCTTDGYTGDTICLLCNETIATGDVIKATGHQIVIDKAVAATYTSTGLTQGSHCSVCNEIIVPQLIVAKKTLATPSLSSAVNSASGITIKWSQVKDAEGYYVYRKTSSGSWKKIGTVTTTVYLDKTATSGTNYYYTVRAFVGNALSSYDKSGKSSIRLTQPTLSVSNSSSGITVKWNKITGAAGYYVYRKTSGGSWSKVGTTTSAITYTDKTAKAGVSYIYTVKAYKNGSYSSYDSKGKTLKRLTQPSFTLSNASKGITIKWSKITGASGYKVYRKAGNAKSWSLVATITNGSTITWTDTKTSNGTKYVYTVKAYSGSYSSSYSSGSTMYRLVSPTISKLTNSSTKKMTVKWNRNTTATGYQIYYKTGTTAKTITVSGNKNISKVIASLIKNKTYSVYVRSYKTVSNVKYYSAWSAYKNIKISK